MEEQCDCTQRDQVFDVMDKWLAALLLSRGIRFYGTVIAGSGKVHFLFEREPALRLFGEVKPWLVQILEARDSARETARYGTRQR